MYIWGSVGNLGEGQVKTGEVSLIGSEMKGKGRQ